MIKQKRRKGAFLLGAMTFMMLTTPVVSAQNKDATVIAKKAIVRSSHDFDGKAIKTLDIGTKVSIEDEEGDWLKIKSPDTDLKGWIHKDILLTKGKQAGILKKGVVNASSLNIRSTPSTSAKIVTSLTNGSSVNILKEENDWYQIQLSNGVKAFAHADYIESVPNHPQGKTLESKNHIMSKPEVKSETVTTLKKDTEVYIKGYDSGWYNVVTKDQKEGWIDSSIVDVEVNKARSTSRSGMRNTELGNIKSVASQYLGRPYNYGSAGPNSFDCSGFVYYVLNTHYKDYLRTKNINLPRTSRGMATIGTSISRSQLEVGDLVFFNNGSNKTINHVGIYIGDNNFIHASSGGKKAVIISSLGLANYNRRYHTAVRL